MKSLVPFLSLTFLVSVAAAEPNANKTSHRLIPVFDSVPDSIELKVLKDFYDSLQGSGWTSKTNWPTGTWPSSASSTVFGTWEGVTVDQGDIVQLNFNTQNLTGHIPSTLGSLTALQQLVLPNNHISGRVPASIGNLNQLTTLHLASNQLSGISPEIGNLPQLMEIYLNGNQLSQPLPKELGNLSNLLILNISYNQLPGPIPAELGNLTLLRTLNLEGNSITGGIPKAFGNLTSLTSLQLGYNLLSGPIPPELGNLDNLQYLYLFGNKLSGTVPTELGQLSNLLILYLSGNNLTGGIPASLGELSSVLQIFLDNNKLSGSIPVELGSIASLTYLNASGNMLSGNIPVELGNLGNLQSLYLNYNQLTGPIPAELGNLSNLQYLALYGNYLQGNIPSSLGDLTSLLLMDLGTNKLDGSIPTEFGEITPLQYIDLHNNHLSGAIPETLFDLNNLNYINLSSNKLTSLPDISGISNPGSRSISISYNSIPFGDIESYFTAGVSPFAYFDCVTQTEYLPLDIEVSNGSTLVISLLNPGSYTTVTWTKKVGTDWQNINSENEDATQMTFRKTNVTDAIAGLYRAGVENSKFPGSNLTSNVTKVATTKSNVAHRLLDNWSFQYKYDKRRRMTHKRVPGADWVYMVYDDRDRLVMTQDGNQREINQWTYTKYDALNRPIITGLYNHTEPLEQDEMSELIDQANFYEHFDAQHTSSFGYSNNIFPTGGQIQTVTWYDNYDFKNVIDDSALEYKTGELTDQVATPMANVIGLATATCVRVGDQNQFLMNVNYFDAKYRVIQTISDTHIGGRQRTTNVVDFVGKVTSSITHNERGVGWKDAMGVAVTASSITKIDGTGWGNGGVASTDMIPANSDGWLEVTVSETNTDRMIGFSAVNADAGYASIDYAFYLAPNLLTVYEHGSDRGVNTSLQSGDVLRIRRVSGSIEYLQNGEVIYTSLTPTDLALLIDVSMYQQGSTLTKIKSSIQSGIPDSFIKRRMVYDHAGRLKQIFHQADLTKETAPRPPCNDLWTDAIGVNISGTFLSNAAPTGWGYSGVASIDRLPASTDGWIEVRVSEVNTDRMIGLGSTNPDASFQSIDFALYLAPNLLTIFEGGLNRNVNASLSTGDVLRIERVGSEIRYRKNGTILYISGASSTSELMVDVSFYQTNATLNNISASFFSPSKCEVEQTAAAGPEILLLQNEYNELGQLIDKKLYSTNNGTTFKQSVDYRYNIRGWLTSINNAALENNGNNNDDANDLFGMNLAYNKTDLGTSNTGLFNGNISAMTWSSNLGLATIKQRGYNFNYDPMNRILSAEHMEKTTGWTSSSKFSENGYAYDLNGNIQSLTRRDAKGKVMDDLTYDYGAGDSRSNRLMSVSDNGDRTTGFKDAPHDSESDYDYDRNGNMVRDLNKGLDQPDAIKYNYLNLPTEVWKGNGDHIFYTYDATGRKLEQRVLNGGSNLLKKTDYVGDYYYENDTLKFVNTEEGRALMTRTKPEYQYHLKDHLGNVRLTFTTKDEMESDLATVETDSLTHEQATFLGVDKARRINATIFDHTYNNVASTNGAYSVRLSGTPNERTGLARSLSVMPGDVIHAEVYVKYVDRASTNDPALIAALGVIASGASLPAGTVIDGSAYSSSSTAFYPFSGYVTHSDVGDGPKAYLNYAIFDRDYAFKTSGFRRVTTDAKETGDLVHHAGLSSEGGDHLRLAFDDGTITITEPGYVYIWLSNENDDPVEVFFDDFRVTHFKSPVIQSQDYFPFGLAFNSYSRENSTLNQYLYNGKERQDELNLGWDDYGWRMYQSEIGRWNRIDDKADKYYSLSPFNFVANNPIVFVDNKGQDIIVIGSGGYNKSVANAFVEYVKTPEGARVFEKLRSADNIRVVIHQGAAGDNALYHTDESGGVQTVYIHYDPNSSGTVDGVLRTGITSLAHELKHGEQKLDGEDTESPVLDSDQTSETDRNGYDQERTVKIGDFGAVDSENKVRSSLGLGIRKSYDGFDMSNRTYSSDNRRVNIPGIGTYTGKVTVTKSGISYASFSGKTAQAVFSKLLANIKAGKSVNVGDYKPKSGSKKVRFNRDDQATSYDD